MEGSDSTGESQQSSYPATPPAQPVHPQMAPPNWVYWCGLVWAVCLVAWIPVVMHLESSGADPAEIQRGGLEVAALAVVATLAFGAVLGWSSSWREVGAAALIGAGVIVAGLGVWALSAPSVGGESDSEGTIGAAVVVFYPLAAVAIGTLLSAGAAVAAGVKRLRVGR